MSRASSREMPTVESAAAPTSIAGPRVAAANCTGAVVATTGMGEVIIAAAMITRGDGSHRSGDDYPMDDYRGPPDSSGYDREDRDNRDCGR